jgi:hypothetical protein
MTNRKKLFILVGALLSLGVLIIVVYSLIPRASILFSIAPGEATVIINGRQQGIKSGERVSVGPGEVSVEVKRDEFVSHVETFTLENGGEYEVLVALDPRTAAARALLTSSESQLIIQRIAGRDLRNGVEELNTAYPILKDLPIIDRFYKIIICESQKFPQDESKLAVCIQLYDVAARRSALNEIKRLGYNLADYEVIVQDISYKTIREESGE